MCYVCIYIYVAFFLCYTGEALKGPISTGVSNKLNNIDSNNGILISKNTILYIYIYTYAKYIFIEY